ncbi:MAG: M28 family peptidase, partial [Tepidisphaeraceae bacterium]
LGLRPPPGQESYFQPFDYTVITGPSAQTALSAAGKSYSLNTHLMPVAMSAEKEFSGSLAFVGYGISGAKEKDGGQIYDDYAGVDVKGKVVLAMRFEPHDAKGKSRIARIDFSEFAALNRKARAAADRGAVALLVVQPPNHHGGDALSPMGRRQMDAVSIPVVQVTQAVANEMLAAAGLKNLREYQNEIDGSFKPQSADSGSVVVKGSVVFERITNKLRNVMAWLPGNGPHSEEIIVIGAHYDHLGRGGPGSRSPRSHEIHHGADDNASGTAALLELARILSSGTPLPRSVLFMAFSGEEMGLLGSLYWVDHPTVPIADIKAMINLDMVGRLKDNVLQVGGTGTAPAFEHLIDNLPAGKSFTLKTTWKDGRAPSDITSFVARRIPGLFLWTGFHEDYHRPTDTSDKINYNGEARIVDLTAQAAVEVAYLPRKALAYTAPPPATQPATPATTRPGAGVSLGVIPDYSAETGAGGVKITGTTPGSAADKAGLHPGDVLIRFGGRKIENLYDLTDVLNAGTPGVPVKLQVIRNGQELELEATPTPRRAPQQ